MQIDLCSECILNNATPNGKLVLCDECTKKTLQVAAMDDTRRFLRTYPGSKVLFRCIPDDELEHKELLGLCRYVFAQMEKYRGEPINGLPLDD
jgi:hypothetical protein